MITENNDICYINNYLVNQIYKIENIMDIADFAKKHNVLVENCIYENSQLKHGDYVAIKANNYNNKVKIHIVRPGETIADISKRYNISEDIIKINNKIDKVFVGQQLLI